MTSITISKITFIIGVVSAIVGGIILAFDYSGGVYRYLPAVLLFFSCLIMVLAYTIQAKYN